jgi:hypothetical protein
MKRLLDLLNAHQGEFNVSVIVPIEHESFDKEVNRNRVKEAIKEAGEKILSLRTDYDFLIAKAITLFDQIDWDHPTKGVGLFQNGCISVSRSQKRSSLVSCLKPATSFTRSPTPCGSGCW